MAIPCYISSIWRKNCPAANAVGAHVYWTQPDSKAPCPVRGDWRGRGCTRNARGTSAVHDVRTVLGVAAVGDFPRGANNVDVRAVAAGVQQIIRRTYNQIALPHVESLRNILNASTAPRRFVTSLALLLALSATLLAAIGLYGLLSLSVRSAPARSACGWRWAHRQEKSFGWSCPRRWRSRSRD